MPAFRNRLCTTAAMLAVGVAVFAAPASAEQANLKSMSLDVQPIGSTIHIVSTDGQKWDKIKPGPVAFTGHMKIDTKWPGFVQNVAVVLGVCGPDQCGPFPSVWSATPDNRDYNATEAMSFDASKLPLSSATGIAIVSFGDQAIKTCNQHLQADGPTKSHSFSQDLDLTFAADTGIDYNMNNNVYEATDAEWPYAADNMDKAAHDKLAVQVVCDPVIKSPTSDLKQDFGDFGVENVKLFLTTYQSNQPGSTPGTVCPALKVTSRAEANQAGPVAMRIWRQKDGGPITSEFKEAWASFDAAKNGYFATYETWENVGKTSYYQFKTEIVSDDPFAPFDGWKDITVHCTGAGGGGLTDGPQNDHDNPPAHSDWTGAVTVSDSAGTRNKLCPREGQVAFEVERAEPGSFHYRISCSNGAYFTGTEIAFNQGGVFKASAAHDLSISRTRKIQCTLQEIKQNGSIATVDKDDEDFTCIKRTIDPASDDLTSSTRPDVDRPKPHVPPVVIDPGRKCLPSQTLLRGKCVDKPVVEACKANEKRAPNGRCIGVSIHCLPGFHQVGLKCVRKPDVSILCKPGFELKGKTCVRKPTVVAACRAGQIRIDGKCVKKPTVVIDCMRGYHLVGKRCVKNPVVVEACKKTEKMVRGHCVPKQPVKKLILQKFKPDSVKKLQPRKLRRIN